jgi:putative acetyltransferase
MRTHPQHLRQGVATHLLDYLLKIAKHSNFQKVSLETGKTPTLMQQFIYTRNLVS